MNLHFLSFRNLKIKLPITILLLLCWWFSHSQDSVKVTYLSTNNKGHFFYLTLSGPVAVVYEMGHYFDKGGTGYSIKNVDTLAFQHDGTYSNGQMQVVRQRGRYFMTSMRRKKLSLDTVTNAIGVYVKLNNGYYLDQYFKMSDELNTLYPLYHHTFRNGFDAWDNLANKAMNHSQFRKLADGRLQVLRDSIVGIQDRYVSVTRYILANIQTLDYHVLRDSLMLLPAEHRSSSWYYGTIVSEIAKHRPADFLTLAEDFPTNQSVIFAAVDESKHVLQALKAVEGHDTVKKLFFKQRKFEKTLLIQILVTYAVIGGLLTWVIVSS